jgi:transcriptional regulator with AAA-type ATPase domain
VIEIASRQEPPAMPLFSPIERQTAAANTELAYSNPFTPRRIELDRTALGDEFDDGCAFWNIQPNEHDDYPNVHRLVNKADRLVRAARQRQQCGRKFAPGEDELLRDLVLFCMYDRLRARHELSPTGIWEQPTVVWQAFLHDAEDYLGVDRAFAAQSPEFTHLFACFYQLRRAFYNAFHFLIGGSRPAVRLRAEVWQSIFTHDMRRYHRVLFDRMKDFTTLIRGPTGAGKELVARAVGLSQYLPATPGLGEFTRAAGGAFFALNLSAMSPTLIESELFGHKRGAFTGAEADRVGWLEICPAGGAVFLDEIGDLDPSIQLKLLRVLQTREFSRLGESTTRIFQGRIIAASNRDIEALIAEGRFREDLYYRLCSDVIYTPSLAERIADDADELPRLIEHIVKKLLGVEEASVAAEVIAWIDRHLSPHYAWPGNVRELEQCVRNVLIRSDYRPHPTSRGNGREQPASLHARLREVLAGAPLTADQLLRVYCTLGYAETGNYKAASQRLGIDQRTLKSKIDPAMLGAFKTGASENNHRDE